jgi:Helix-turn-helix domain
MSETKHTEPVTVAETRQNLKNHRVVKTIRRKRGDVFESIDTAEADEEAARRPGFTQVPNALLRSPLSDGETRCASLLLTYARQDGYTYVNQSTLARDMGKSEREVRRIVKRLKKVGLISAGPRKYGRGNLYNVENLHALKKRTTLPKGFVF